MRAERFEVGFCSELDVQVLRNIQSGHDLKTPSPKP